MLVRRLKLSGITFRLAVQHWCGPCPEDAGAAAVQERCSPAALSITCVTWPMAVCGSGPSPAVIRPPASMCVISPGGGTSAAGTARSDTLPVPPLLFLHLSLPFFLLSPCLSLHPPHPLSSLPLSRTWGDGAGPTVTQPLSLLPSPPPPTEPRGMGLRPDRPTTRPGCRRPSMATLALPPPPDDGSRLTQMAGGGGAGRYLTLDHDPRGETWGGGQPESCS